MDIQQQSLTKQVRQLEKYILTLPSAKRLNSLDRAQRDSMIKLRDKVSDGRHAVEVYVSSDDTQEQAQALDDAIESLKVVGTSILAASSYDLLDVTDVAHLSAINEHIIDQLK